MSIYETGWPGIAVEFDPTDPGQIDFPNFVIETLFMVSELGNAKLPSFGMSFLREFSVGDLKSFLTEGDTTYRLLIRPPIIKKAIGGHMTNITLAETKEFNPDKVEGGKVAQIIECWWPGSGTSRIRQAIRILPLAWTKPFGEGKIALDGDVPSRFIKGQYKTDIKGDIDKVTKDYTLKPHEFFYQGQLHTYQIALIHEMIHAWHGINGTSRVSIGSKDTKEEEKQVVGLPPYLDNRYTENKFRAVMNMPSRPDYLTLDLKLKRGKETDSFRDAFESWCVR